LLVDALATVRDAIGELERERIENSKSSKAK
jgi:hypothetical protein